MTPLKNNEKFIIPNPDKLEFSKVLTRLAFSCLISLAHL